MGKSLFSTLKAYTGSPPSKEIWVLSKASWGRSRLNSRNLLFLEPDLVHTYSEVGPSEFNGADSQICIGLQEQTSLKRKTATASSTGCIIPLYFKIVANWKLELFHHAQLQHFLSFSFFVYVLCVCVKLYSVWRILVNSKACSVFLMIDPVLIQGIIIWLQRFVHFTVKLYWLCIETLRPNIPL